MSNAWAEDEIRLLIENYPTHGLAWCCDFLNKRIPQIRAKASRLGLRQDRSSDFFIDWQRRAAESKIGKKRPDQSEVMKNLHRDGKLIRTDAVNKLIGKKVSEFFNLHGHPKGFLGKNHSDASKAKIGEASLNLWNSLSDEEKLERIKISSKSKCSSITKRYSASWKCGKRIIGDCEIFFRSSWEANYARYLEYLKLNEIIASWEYESFVFEFDESETNRFSYLPDFRVINNDDSIVFHEVKGWFDERSIALFKQMNEFYPEVELLVIDSVEYKKIRSSYKSIIDGWE